MLCSDDDQLIAKAKHWATQAKDPGPLYFHSEMGYNYRMSNVLAAIGIAQLNVLDDRVAARKRNYEYYREHLAPLPGIQLASVMEYGDPNYWLSVIRVDPESFGATCEEIRLALEDENIESRRVWVPLHTLPVFAGCRYRGGDVAEKIFSDGLCLPSGSAMTEADLDRTVQVIRGLAK